MQPTGPILHHMAGGGAVTSDEGPSVMASHVHLHLLPQRLGEIHVSGKNNPKIERFPDSQATLYFRTKFHTKKIVTSTRWQQY